MLTESLTARLEELAGGQPFVADLTPVLVQARRRRRHRRIRIGLASVIASAGMGAGGLAMTVSVSRSATLAPAEQPDGAPPVSFHTVAVTTPYADTCVDMTFTETEQTVRVGCRQSSWAFPTSERMTGPQYAQVSVRAHEPPTWIAYGEAARSDSSVTVWLNTGQRESAMLIEPPRGYPYYPVYLVDLGADANIGPGANWIKTLTDSDDRGSSTIHDPPMATPASSP